MYDDWIFGGQLSYIAEHVDTKCEEFTVIVSADYPDSVDPLRIMFRVEYNDTFSALISNASNITVSDPRTLNKSKLCIQMYQIEQNFLSCYRKYQRILFIVYFPAFY